MKYSIKTIGGNRYEVNLEKPIDIFSIMNNEDSSVVMIEFDDGTVRYFPKYNIDCITERKE